MVFIWNFIFYLLRFVGNKLQVYLRFRFRLLMLLAPLNGVHSSSPERLKRTVGQLTAMSNRLDHDFRTKSQCAKKKGERSKWIAKTKESLAIRKGFWMGKSDLNQISKILETKSISLPSLEKFEKVFWGSSGCVLACPLDIVQWSRLWELCAAAFTLAIFDVSPLIASACWPTPAGGNSLWK